jgi:hypothetical protein
MEVDGSAQWPTTNKYKIGMLSKYSDIGGRIQSADQKGWGCPGLLGRYLRIVKSVEINIVL